MTTPLHILSRVPRFPLPVHLPRALSRTTHNLTTHDLFPFLHLLLQSNSTHFSACIQHSIQYLALIVLPPASTDRPKPKPEPKPAPARHRKTHPETRSSRSQLYRTVHTFRVNAQPTIGVSASSCSRGITRPSSRPLPPMTSARPLAFIFALQ